MADTTFLPLKVHTLHYTSATDIRLPLRYKGLVCCQCGYLVSGFSGLLESDVDVLLFVKGVGTADSISIWRFGSSIGIYQAFDEFPILLTGWVYILLGLLLLASIYVYSWYVLRLFVFFLLPWDPSSLGSIFPGISLFEHSLLCILIISSLCNNLFFIHMQL